MGSTRKNYPARFKVKVVIAAIKGDKTLARIWCAYESNTAVEKAVVIGSRQSIFNPAQQN